MKIRNININIVILILSFFCCCPSFADEFPKHSNYQTVLNSANYAMVKDALNRIIEVNSRDSKGATALIHASTLGLRSDVNKLLEMGADVNARKLNGSTALIAAAQTGRDTILEDLFLKGADLELTALDGAINALFQASNFGYAKCVKALLRMGAMPTPGPKTYSPLKFALFDMTKTTIIAMPKPNYEIVEALLSAGADINTRFHFDSFHPSMLHVAVINEDRSLTSFLLDKGANPNISSNPAKLRTDLGLIPQRLPRFRAILTSSNNEGFGFSDPLEIAAFYRDFDLMKKLILKGAKFEMQEGSINKWSLLHWFAAHGYLDLVKFLVTNGANIDAVDDNNNTALHFALANGEDEIFDYLESNGARTNIRSIGSLGLDGISGSIDEIRLREKQSEIDFGEIAEKAVEFAGQVAQEYERQQKTQTSTYSGAYGNSLSDKNVGYEDKANQSNASNTSTNTTNEEWKPSCTLGHFGGKQSEYDDYIRTQGRNMHVTCE